MCFSFIAGWAGKFDLQVMSFLGIGSEAAIQASYRFFRLKMDIVVFYQQRSLTSHCVRFSNIGHEDATLS